MRTRILILTVLVTLTLWLGGCAVRPGGGVNQPGTQPDMITVIMAEITTAEQEVALLEAAAASLPDGSARDAMLKQLEKARKWLRDLRAYALFGILTVEVAQHIIERLQPAATTQPAR